MREKVWVIFFASMLLIAVAALVVIKTGHKMYLSMKKDEHEFNKKYEEEK